MMNRLAKILDRFPIELFLIALTVAAYWRVQNLWFAFDDAMYIFGANHVSNGLNWPDIKWALTSGYAANWHPLTWISYMVDSQIAGESAKQFHLTNLLLHIAATMMLFLVLTRMTKAVWRSAFVAALFALHPLHVESVAWVSERKDVLSAFFMMLTFWAYVKYAARPGWKTYLPIVIFFVLGLMSKPMLVSLPFLLLLLDFWPLRRSCQLPVASCQSGPDRDQPANAETINHEPSTIPPPPQQLTTNNWQLFREKLPLFAISAASCVVTFLVQRAGGAFGQVSEFPLHIRLMNAVYSYVIYIRKMFWPVDLACFYPHPGYDLKWWVVGLCGLFLVGMTVFALRSIRSRPYLAFGWIWYVFTLIPVIGIVQVGNQGMADRYTYIPLIGLFVMLAWGIPDLLDRIRKRPSNQEQRPFAPLLSLVAVVLILGLAAMTRFQVRHWRNNLTLFSHAIAVTKNNMEAHIDVGATYQELGDYERALEEYRKAAEINDEFAPLHFNIGLTLMQMGRDDEAMKEYKRALEITPGYAPSYNNMGQIYARRGEIEKARECYEKAIEQEPEYADALVNLGNLLDSLGRTDEALVRYDEALAFAPRHADAHFNKGVMLHKLRRLDEAIDEYEAAISAKPSLLGAHRNLATALYSAGRYEEAWDEVYEVYRLKGEVDPGFLAALSAQMPDPYGE